MSFLKQLPPNPMPALRNLSPIRGSQPMDAAASSTSAPVYSQMAASLLMLLIRCASIELATSLESSEDHTLVVMMRSRGTQAAYTSANVSAARRPAAVGEDPMSTRSG